MEHPAACRSTASFTLPSSLVALVFSCMRCSFCGLLAAEEDGGPGVGVGRAALAPDLEPAALLDREAQRDLDGAWVDAGPDSRPALRLVDRAVALVGEQTDLELHGVGDRRVVRSHHDLVEVDPR